MLGRARGEIGHNVLAPSAVAQKHRLAAALVGTEEGEELVHLPRILRPL